MPFYTLSKFNNALFFLFSFKDVSVSFQVKSTQKNVHSIAKIVTKPIFYPVCILGQKLLTKMTSTKAVLFR